MMHVRDLFSLDNQVAIVTGSAGILGRAFCESLCALGASVACIDVSQSALDEQIQCLRKTFGDEKAAGFLCDISDANAVKQTVADIMAQYSSIDILLNNAATKTSNLTDFFRPFSDYPVEVWREVMSVNLDGMFLMAQAVGAHMLTKQKGCIVQTASIYALMGADSRIYEGSEYLGQAINTPAVYTASKAGVIGLTKHLSTMWAKDGIRVNALCPGGVSDGQNTTFSQQYSARVPMGRMASLPDIVGPMMFLVSDASKYMTGQVLYADGGLSAW